MAKAETLVQSVPGLPGHLPTPEVVVVAPLNENTTSSNTSLPHNAYGLCEEGAPPPFAINVHGATPTPSIDDESCLEEDTELHLSDNTTIHHQNKTRPLSVASATSRTNSSLLALPDNMRSLIRSLANRARGEKTDGAMDLGVTPATSVSDLRPINSGLLRRRLDSFARRPESDADGEVDDEKTKNSFRLCKRCPRIQSHVAKLTNHLKSVRCTCNYYVDPYGKCMCTVHALYSRDEVSTNYGDIHENTIMNFPQLHFLVRAILSTS